MRDPAPTEITVVAPDLYVKVVYEDGTGDALFLHPDDWVDLDAVAGGPVHAIQWKRNTQGSTIEWSDNSHKDISGADLSDPVINKVLERFAAGVARRDALNLHQVTADSVRNEAHRRIVRVAPEWQQRNLLARSLELADIRHSRPLNAEELSEADGVRAVWAEISRLRAVSNTLEPNPPEDFAADHYWAP